jgi:predicted Holliday junction resolvase-like endonuclease
MNIIIIIIIIIIIKMQLGWHLVAAVYKYTQRVHRKTEQYNSHLQINSTQKNTAVQHTYTHKQ